MTSLNSKAQIITIRPGPVLHVWQGGCQIAAVPLTPNAALAMCRDLLGEVKCVDLENTYCKGDQ